MCAFINLGCQGQGKGPQLVGTNKMMGFATMSLKYFICRRSLVLHVCISPAGVDPLLSLGTILQILYQDYLALYKPQVQQTLGSKKKKYNKH